MIARIGASTEKQPFTAQAQGISRGAEVLRTEMPKGKGMPIRMPAGMTVTKESMIFIGRGNRPMNAITVGSRRLMAMTTPARTRRMLERLSALMCRLSTLPMPEQIRSDAMTALAAKDGFSRPRIIFWIKAISMNR